MKKTTMIINNNDNNNNDDFRPRLGMGWFGLCVDYENKTFTRFSSPAWGWGGSECREDDESFKKFLSPLGDGLVLNLLAFTPVKMRFSSPLGDGLVLLDGKATTLKVIIFVPAWGWVGSRRKNY